MKNLLTLIVFLITLTISAQAPQGFNYQATVRNNAGALMINKNVTFKFNVMKDTPTSVPVFSETHYVPTDDLGAVNLVIGKGTATSGTFATIDWATGTYYLGIELNTGNDFVAMGTTQLLSVPYALYASNSGSATIPNLASVLAKNNSANNTKITNLADPTDAQDATTKNYVDTQLQTQIATLQAQITALQNLPLTSGAANFLKYVALGDSFTAGFSDGALFIEAQKGAYPNLLAQQFAAAGGGTFSTPLMSDNFGGLLLGGNVIATQRLYFNGAAPVAVSGTPTTNVTTKVIGPFNNLGVPVAKIYHLVASGYGNAAGFSFGLANPYYARFSTSATSTVLSDAVSQTPTFFSLWIGGWDVLGYATSGGIGVNQTGNSNPATYGANDITDPTVFASVYSTLVTSLTAGGAKGVVANLPYINTLPYFTTIPINPLSTSALGGGNVTVGQATINTLNTQLYGPLKQVLTAFGEGDRVNLLSTTTANPLLIKDESLTNLNAQITAAFTPSLGAQTAAVYGAVFGQARQAKATDLILWSAQNIIGAAPTETSSGLGIAPPSPLNTFGITFPLQDTHVLIPSEIAEIKVATDAYNSTIQSLAFANGLAFVNLNSIFNQINTGGIVSNGITIRSTFVTGGMFSLDGVHPSPRGYALIANKFSEAINTAFGSNLKNINIGNYQILFPSSL